MGSPYCHSIALSGANEVSKDEARMTKSILIKGKLLCQRFVSGMVFLRSTPGSVITSFSSCLYQSAFCALVF
jgi:hypothetical protein